MAWLSEGKDDNFVVLENRNKPPHTAQSSIFGNLGPSLMVKNSPDHLLLHYNKVFFNVLPFSGALHNIYILFHNICRHEIKIVREKLTKLKTVHHLLAIRDA